MAEHELVVRVKSEDSDAARRLDAVHKDALLRAAGILVRSSRPY